MQRVLADMVKCFRHVNGAAQIFQTRTNATQLCSSSLGRQVFNWYRLIEDECCLILSCRGALPTAWRQEHFRIRKIISVAEHKLLPTEQLQGRILEDVLQATLDILPAMADALATIPDLKRSTGDERAKIIARLEKKMVYILDYVESVRTSRLVAPLIQTVEVGFPWQTKHATCCPDLPFSPFRFVHPQAGIIFVCLEAIHLYVQVCHPPPVFSPTHNLRPFSTPLSEQKESKSKDAKPNPNSTNTMLTKCVAAMPP
jgi:hypothetical protein